MQIDLKRFHAAFFDEAAEHLAVMEESLLALERMPEDGELLNRIFRAAHSVKGASGTFGFTDIAAFTHSLESLLDRMRDREITTHSGPGRTAAEIGRRPGHVGGRSKGRRSAAARSGATGRRIGQGPPRRPRRCRGNNGKEKQSACPGDRRLRIHGQVRARDTTFCCTAWIPCSCCGTWLGWGESSR